MNTETVSAAQEQAGLDAEGSDAVQTEAASGEATHLVWWKFNDEACIDAALERWNEEHPDRQIDLDIQKYSLEEMTSKLQMALSTGTGVPDIVDVEISKLGLFMSDNEEDIPFVPLDEWVEENEASLQM